MEGKILDAKKIALFQPFVEKFKLQEIADYLYLSLGRYFAGEISKPALYQLIMKRALLPLSDYYKMTSELNKLLISDINVTESVPSDAPILERRQDLIFHELLDLIKSFKLKKDLDRRLFNVFVSFLKGIRDDLETREILLKEQAKGGLAFDSAKSETIIIKFKDIISQIQIGQFKSEEIVDWFKKHYDSILLSSPVTTDAVDLPLPEEKVKFEEHRTIVEAKSADKGISELLAEKKPSHDLSQPLPQHIAMHQKEVTAPIEIAAPIVVKKELLAAPAPSVIPPARPQPSVGGRLGDESPFTAPTEAIVTSKISAGSVMSKPMNDMTSVDIKPVRADLPLPTRKIPEELKQMLAQDLGTSLPVMPMPAKEIKSKPVKVSFFKRLFGKKTAIVPVSAPIIPAKINNSSFPSPAPAPAPSTPMVRSRMDDITHTTKLFGPVDELLSLSLADFRRLAKDPVVACKKIKDKIELLAHESLDKRAEAIGALTKSELYRQYSDIMNASVMEGKPFTEILTAKKTMTEPEFRALMQLNKDLRS